MLHLWHTKNFTTTTSSVLAPVLRHTSGDFVLEFLPERPLAVTTRKKDKAATVFDLKSGALQLTIDVSIKVCAFRSIENAIVVIGYEKAITWNLPGGYFLGWMSRTALEQLETAFYLCERWLPDLLAEGQSGCPYLSIVFLRSNSVYSVPGSTLAILCGCNCPGGPRPRQHFLKLTASNLRGVRCVRNSSGSVGSVCVSLSFLENARTSDSRVRIVASKFSLSHFPHIQVFVTQNLVVS